VLIRRQYQFPRPEIEGLKAVEEKYLELTQRKRNGDKLDPEEVDYLDFANNTLLEA
jgi:hypothetical protein